MNSKQKREETMSHDNATEQANTNVNPENTGHGDEARTPDKTTPNTTASVNTPGSVGDQRQERRDAATENEKTDLGAMANNHADEAVDEVKKPAAAGTTTEEAIRITKRIEWLQNKTSNRTPEEDEELQEMIAKGVRTDEGLGKPLPAHDPTNDPANKM